MSEAIAITMLWKSTLVCAGVLLVLKAARNHSPAQRAATLIAGMALLALLPLLSLLLPPLQLHSAAAPIAELPIDVSAALAQAPATVPLDPQTTAPSLSTPTLIGLLWLAGALFVLARLASGILTLRRWTTQATPVNSIEAERALERIGGARVKLLVSDEVDAPLSWGWRSPVILLNPETVADPRDAEAVIAHELAHIRRGDWPGLLFARLVVALYWFNPLVWLIEREFLHEAEQAADAEALRSVQPALYARTLLKLASGCRVVAGANSIAAGGLKRRILRIIAGRDAGPAARWKVVATYAGLAVALPIAAIEFVPAAHALMPNVKGEAGPQIRSTPLAPTLMAMSSPAGASLVAYPPRPSDRHRPHSAAQPDTRYAGKLTQESLDRARDAEQQVRDAQVRARDAEQRVGDAQIRAAEAQQRALAATSSAGAVMERSMQVAATASQTVAAAMQQMAADMATGAEKMDHGAQRMLDGSQKMRDEAVRLRDPAYRQRKIAEQAAQGRHVTDHELIDFIPQLEKGADEMVKGAADMRRGAEEMRHSAREPR